MSQAITRRTAQDQEGYGELLIVRPLMAFATGRSADIALLGNCFTIVIITLVFASIENMNSHLTEFIRMKNIRRIKRR